MHEPEADAKAARGDGKPCQGSFFSQHPYEIGFGALKGESLRCRFCQERKTAVHSEGLAREPRIGQEPLEAQVPTGDVSYGKARLAQVAHQALPALPAILTRG